MNAIEDDVCMKCVFAPPSDRSICGDCVSSDEKGKAGERIKKLELETGFKMEYKGYNSDASIESWGMVRI